MSSRSLLWARRVKNWGLSQDRNEAPGKEARSRPASSLAPRLERQKGSPVSSQLAWLRPSLVTVCIGQDSSSMGRHVD